MSDFIYIFAWMIYNKLTQSICEMNIVLFSMSFSHLPSLSHVRPHTLRAHLINGWMLKLVHFLFVEEAGGWFVFHLWHNTAYHTPLYQTCFSFNIQWQREVVHHRNSRPVHAMTPVSHPQMPLINTRRIMKYFVSNNCKQGRHWPAHVTGSVG